MPFLVKYLQDVPKNCGECPCSIHITPKEVYCNARQKHFEVTDERPNECSMMECDNSSVSNKNEEKCKPESCNECMYHCVDGLFDYCGLEYGMLLIDYNTDYEKQRDPKCPLN